MIDARKTAHAAANRLSTVLNAIAHNPKSLNASLDVSAPLIAAFEALVDEIDALKRKVEELQQKR